MAPSGHTSRLSLASLEEMDRSSPVDSNASLEEWLKSPSPIEVTPESLVSVSSGPLESPPITESMRPIASRVTSTGSVRFSANFSRPMSVAGSDGSASSLCSYGSQRSLDCRGLRRGRRQWRKPVPPTRVASPRPLIQTSASRTYYCTWADCAKVFKTRYEWVRHEEAMHYFPRRWICCYEPANDLKLPECFVCQKPNVSLVHIVDNHLQACREKTELDRTFWRPDQLAQHFQRIHSLPIPTEVRQAWLSTNPQFNEDHLRCGFCGLFPSTWEERKDHVAWHIQEGATKDMWWPNREFMSRKHYEAVSASESPADPSEIRSWSCRFLDSPRSLVSKCCELCGYVFGEGGDWTLHMHQHDLRQCDQELFSDVESFYHHMIASHGLATEVTFRPYLWHHASSLVYDFDVVKAA
jgi:hypothetical protein